jgi:hypothetical protein
MDDGIDLCQKSLNVLKDDCIYARYGNSFTWSIAKGGKTRILIPLPEELGGADRRSRVRIVGSVQRVLEAFTIILAFTQLLYLLSLHAGLLGDKYGPPSSSASTGTAGQFLEKPPHGTPAAAAV